VSRPSSWRITRGLGGVLTLGVCLSMGTLIWYGYRAVREWQRSATLLAESQASDAVGMLVSVLTGDMRGVQTGVLSSPRWDEFMLDPAYDVRGLVAGAFARYPYPESFFSWSGATPHPSVAFFYRADRRPPWLPDVAAQDPFPVVVGDDPAVGKLFLERIRQEARYGRRFSMFETTLGGVHYQVVARLLYRDAFRERLEGVIGFTVNLAWVRDHYFPDVTRQVARIRPSETTPSLSVVDDQGRLVAGAVPGRPGAPVIRAWFPLVFFDPRLVAPEPPGDLPRPSWAVQAGLDRDPMLAAAVSGANRTMLIAAIAAGALGVGLMLTIRALRTGARLAEMRAEFVSTVTHELKTPIATIRAIGDTLVSGRISGPDAQRDYAQLVVQEAKRLTRLVDNLLAYARITDITEAYAFEALDLASLVDDVIGGFAVQVHEGGVELQLDLPADLPPIRGDRTSLRLMLDNLVDNAIRYSGGARWLQIGAAPDGKLVRVEVRDRGIGIPPDEIGQVTRRFFRGRRARSGGSGLGLAIAARIAGDHGGALTIHSVVDAGTTVCVTLPVAAERT
jgi:signal transduction histidine kinase